MHVSGRPSVLWLHCLGELVPSLTDGSDCLINKFIVIVIVRLEVNVGAEVPAVVTAGVGGLSVLWFGVVVGVKFRDSVTNCDHVSKCSVTFHAQREEAMTGGSSRSKCP